MSESVLPRNNGWGQLICYLGEERYNNCEVSIYWPLGHKYENMTKYLLYINTIEYLLNTRVCVWGPPAIYMYRCFNALIEKGCDLLSK